MEAYSIENLTFSYPEASACALRDVTLSVREGEFLTLCGASGSGKTTLIRLLKPSLAPEGNKFGEIRALAEDCEIGFVMQDPEACTVTDKVWHELAFGLENLGLPNAEIRARVAETAAFFGIDTWFRRDTSALSGGERQILNLASVMAMRPRVLILDEPTSRLDPLAAAAFITAVSKANRELGTTVILTEHRLEDALSVSDRIAVLDCGELFAIGTPREVAARLKAEKHSMLHALPVPSRVFLSADGRGDCPITVREGRAWLQAQEATPPAAAPEIRHGSDTAVSLSELRFRYERNGADILRDLSLEIKKGEFVSVIGGNGSGKTTALSVISGDKKPYCGKVTVNGRTARMWQNPQCMFSHELVSDELRDCAASAEDIERITDICALGELCGRHPYDLSGGEQQRLAFAMLLLSDADILLLDEPTKGIDMCFKRTLGEMLKELCRNGKTVIMVTHDMDFCAEYAHRICLMFDGSVASEGTPRAFFSENTFYTTAARRMSRDIVENAVTVSALLASLGIADTDFTIPHMPRRMDKPAAPAEAPRSPSVQKHTLLSFLIFLLVIPVTILFGIYVLGDRRYLLTSLIVAAEAMLPFFVRFEKRRPTARELVVLAVLVALAVVSRAAFYMLPQFKPMAAVIIIAGVSFGCDAGFMVGASSALVSNFLFAQGPWTPWQMLAFGLIGFAGGLFGKIPSIGKRRILLALVSGVLVLVLYGGIMNPASVIIAQSQPTWQMFAASFIKGIPFDSVHAAATVLYIFLLAPSVLKKLYRVKQKFGM